MQKQSLIINNITFSKHKESIEGQLTVSACDRLTQWLQASPDSTQDLTEVDLPKTDLAKTSEANLIAYQLRGNTNAMDQHSLYLHVDVNIVATCQRCLNAMPISLKLDFNYLISTSDEATIQANDEDNRDDVDLLEANPAMDLAALIEDEIIMAMPISPLHDFNCTEIAMQSGEKPNPFAILKGMLKS